MLIDWLAFCHWIDVTQVPFARNYRKDIFFSVFVHLQEYTKVTENGSVFDENMRIYTGIQCREVIVYGVFKNLHSGERLWKDAFSVTFSPDTWGR